MMFNNMRMQVMECLEMPVSLLICCRPCSCALRICFGI